MTGNQGTGTPKPDDVITLSRDEHAALTLARQQLDEVRAERDALKDGSVALSQRVEALEAAASQRQVADEIREAEGAGKVVTAELRTLLASQPQAARAVILGALPASRPVVALGHGERTEPKDAKDRNISYGEALTLARGE